MLTRGDLRMELDRPKTLTSAVVDYIREAVLRNEFPPGHQLRELHLSQSLSTSRGTVREALRVLHEDGLVKIVPHHGAVVSELSAKRVSEIFDLRALLEGHAVELALSQGLVDDEAVDAMRASYEQMAEIAGGGDHFATVEADMAFHRRMAGYSGHELLLEQLDTLRLQTRQAILYTKLYKSDLEGEAESHAPILEAFVAGDSAKAADAVRVHITVAGERLLARMREGGPDG
jgi:DNA-binding GntR family transcriptional regulator